MSTHDSFDFHVIDADPLEQAVVDGALIPATAMAEREPQPNPLHEITSMDGYLQNYGRILGKKAVTSLAPLHVPGRNPLPDFEDLLREPFDCQKHVAAAGIQMLNTVGSGFIVGEMGTGKTLLGMVTVYLHARQSQQKGGYNGKFRCIVLCPDHLIAKWEREIKETIPGAMVQRFDDWSGIVRLLDKGYKGRWAKPQGPEYYILGRNQAKWYPDWLGTSDPYRGFGGRMVAKPLSSRTIIVDRVPVAENHGKPVSAGKDGVKATCVTSRVFACPCCGAVVRDRKGVPVSGKVLSEKKLTCEGRYLQQSPSRDQKTEHGLDVISPIPARHKDKPVGHSVSIGDHTYVVKECKEPLWWFTSKPYRWSPARIIQKKLRRFFQYLLIDECHEQKSDESAQSMAAGKLISSVDHTIALTGTIIGGYANHLYPLMMRITPETLRAEGFEWGKDLTFSEVYGRIDRIVTIKEEGATPTVSKSVRSMRRAKTGKATERKAVRPGVMPTLFGRHMIGNSIFITLDEMADELPYLHEYVGGASPCAQGDPFWVDTCCTMEPTQKAEYERVESILKFACKELLIRGSMKLLGTMLWTTLGYPDFCYDEWGRDDELAKAIKSTRTVRLRLGGSPSTPWAIGINQATSRSRTGLAL